MLFLGSKRKKGELENEMRELKGWLIKRILLCVVRMRSAAFSPLKVDTWHVILDSS